MSIGYKLADLHIGLGPATGATNPNIPGHLAPVPWAASTTWGALAVCINNGYVFRTVSGGAGNTSGDGPSQANLVDASCTWVAVGPLNPLYAQDAAATVPLGTVAKIVSPDFGEGEAIYVKFTGTVAAGDNVQYDLYAQTCIQASNTTADGWLCGIAMAGQADGKYGWVMIKGVHGAANVINGISAGALTCSATTAGRLITATLVGSAMSKLVGANLRLAPVGALNFGLVEVRYPTFIKTTS